MIILMLLGAVIFSLVAFFVYKKSKTFNGSQKLTFVVLSFLIFTLGLEFTIFNVNFYNTRGNEEISLNQYMSYNSDSNNNYILTAENSVLYFPEIETEVDNIYFNVISSPYKNTPIKIKLSDEANLVTYETPERILLDKVRKSHYINIHASGIVSGLTVDFDLKEDDALILEGIYLNAKRPFEISLVRILVIFTFLGFCYLFSPKSELYKMPLKRKKEEYTVLATFALCVLCSIFAIISIINPLFIGFDITPAGLEFKRLPMQNHNIYDELACALLDGKTYIDNNDVPDSLKELSNPYDTTLRALKSQQTGDKYRWDVAYFDGHYYVYFGIVPLLLMYLPFRLIFSAPFPTVVGIIIFTILFSLGVYKLLTLIAEKKFKNISVGTLLLVLVTSIISCGLMFLVKRPDFYGIPIITGMTFSVFGIYNWLSGIYNEEKRSLKFFLGSLCMALVAGCRPQMLLLTFLAIPLFFRKYIIEKEFKTKKGIKELALLLSPYIVIASGLMFYNFIRFGSPFDFGSNYQLTTNDVTKRGFDMGRTGLGFFTYLFQPPVFSAKFPFLEKVTIKTSYVGKTIVENCFGGLITSTPMLWFLGLLGKARNTLKEKNLLSYTLLLLLSGFIIVFFNNCNSLIISVTDYFSYVCCPSVCLLWINV